MEYATQFLFLGVIGGGIGYVIASALQKRSKTGEDGRAAGGGARNADPGSRWRAGAGLETEVLARIEAIERAFTEQNQEITARFNRLAARSRRREPAGESGPDDASAQGLTQGLTRKQELRAKVAAANKRTHSILGREILDRR